MVNDLINYLKQPVTTVIQKQGEEDLKKGAIKAAILSLIMTIVSIISTVVSIMTMNSKSSFLSKEQIADRRSKAFEDAELLKTFFQTFLGYIIVIAVVALILFVIAKLVKSEKKYEAALSIVNNSIIGLVIVSILNLIVTHIYAPLAMLLSVAASAYTMFTLIYAFKESIEVENIDKLVLITTGVIVATIVIAVLVFTSISGVSLKSLETMSDFMSML